MWQSHAYKIFFVSWIRRKHLELIQKLLKHSLKPFMKVKPLFTMNVYEL